jgi:D-sedoheptulose 7-phosphate isomerase
VLERSPHASWISSYTDTLVAAVKTTKASDRRGASINIDEAIVWVAETARRVHGAGNKIIFIGNGGSAAIASHMATDYSKNGDLRSIAMNDASTLTCLGNDYGYEHVFAKQIEFHAREGDLLVAISSSGKSANILNAVAAARKAGCTVLTLSGFDANNPLRLQGDMNLFLPSGYYGFVEIGHLTLCHAILDYSMERDGRGAAGLKNEALQNVSEKS